MKTFSCAVWQSDGLEEAMPDSQQYLDALWKSFAEPDAQAPVNAPGCAIHTVHGPVLSIVTQQPVPIAELWAQTCAAANAQKGKP